MQISGYGMPAILSSLAGSKLLPHPPDPVEGYTAQKKKRRSEVHQSFACDKTGLGKAIAIC